MICAEKQGIQMVQKFQKDLAQGWLIRNSLKLLVSSFSALWNIDWILQGRIKLQTAARLLNSVVGKSPNMLTHLKSVILSESLAQWFICCAGFKRKYCTISLIVMLLIEQYYSVPNRVGFSGIIFWFSGWLLRSVTECDERTLVSLPLFDTKHIEFVFGSIAWHLGQQESTSVSQILACCC